MMWTKSFWEQSIERAVKTAAQAALAFFVVGETAFHSVSWAEVAGAAAVGAIASVLMSLASSPFGPEESPSLVGEHVEDFH
jgi:hypothetical protein